MYKIKKWAEANYKTSETKYNRQELTSDPVFTDLKKPQRDVTGTILCKMEL